MPATGTVFVQYGNIPDGRPYGIAYVAISSVFIGPLLALLIISLRSLHRAKDPAHRAVTWIKLSLGLWVLFLVLTTIHAGFTLHQVLNDLSFFYQRISITNPRKTLLRLAPISDWFGILANIALSITFIEVGLGFLYCLGKPHGKASSKTRIGLRFLTWIWGVVLFFISAVWYALGQLVLEKALEVVRDHASDMVPGYVLDETVELRKARRKWVRFELILDVFMLLFGLKALVFALVVVVKTRGHRLRNSAMLFISATILNTIRQTCAIIMHAAYVLPLESAPELPSLVHPLVITPLIDFVQIFVILVLLYIITTRKSGGLSSGGYLAPEPDETRSSLLLLHMTPATMKENSRYLIPVRCRNDRDTVVGMQDEKGTISV